MCSFTLSHAHCSEVWDNMEGVFHLWSWLHIPWSFSLSDKCLQSSRGLRNTLTFPTCCACHWLTGSKAPRCVLPFMWPVPCPLLRLLRQLQLLTTTSIPVLVALAVSFSFSLRDFTFQFNSVSFIFLAILLFQNLSVSFSFSPAASASCLDILEWALHASLVPHHLNLPPNFQSFCHIMSHHAWVMKILAWAVAHRMDSSSGDELARWWLSRCAWGLSLQLDACHLPLPYSWKDKGEFFPFDKENCCVVECFGIPPCPLHLASLWYLHLSGASLNFISKKPPLAPPNQSFSLLPPGHVGPCISINISPFTLLYVICSHWSSIWGHWAWPSQWSW